MTSPVTKTVAAELQLSDDQRSNHLEGDAFVRLSHDSGHPWHTRTSIGISVLAQRGHPFTVENIRELGVEEPEHPSSWGQAFQNAQKEGLIVRVGFMQSPRKSRHASVVSVWVGREAA